MSIEHIQWRECLHLTTFQKVWKLYVPSRDIDVIARLDSNDTDHIYFEANVDHMISRLRKCNLLPEETTRAVLEYVLLLLRRERYEGY